MKAFVYMLLCSNGSYYTGSTINLERRLFEHSKGIGSKHTSKHAPVRLVYVEEIQGIREAYNREHQIKKWTRKKKESLINDEISILEKLAECQNSSHSSNK